MRRYLLRRALLFLLVLVGVSVLSFALVGFFGRDPAEIIARRTNIYATYEQIEAVRHSMGLDKPLPARYVAWLCGLFRGDVGVSIYTYEPIMEDIAGVMPVSLTLVGLAMAWVVVISVPVSLLCALRPGGAADHIVRAVSVVGLSFPTFWLGFLLLIAFAVKRPIFTVLPAPGLKGYLLPSIALAVPVIAGFIRVFRASLLKEGSAAHIFMNMS